MNKPLVTISGGVAEVAFGDVLTVDFDDWNDETTTSDQRQEIIEAIQAAGYRAVVWSYPGETVLGLRIFQPEEAYDQLINSLEGDVTFAVHDPLAERGTTE